MIGATEEEPRTPYGEYSMGKAQIEAGGARLELPRVSEQAMTLRGLAAGVAGWFGREPVLDLVDWAEFERRVGTEHATVSREHALRSITASIARAREVLGYVPRHTSLDTRVGSNRRRTRAGLAAAASTVSAARRTRATGDRADHPIVRRTRR